MKRLIGITLLAFLIVVIVIMAMECQGITTTEANDMTMHKFPHAQSLAQVVGQDRYTLANVAERLDGIVRRGTVTRVRPTGEGFEFSFPAGVDTLYLVDVEIYNPGARPVTLEGIESVIPVRPGQGVRVLIPGGDVTRGPIVIGRLTPEITDGALFTRAEPLGINTGFYPAIGKFRVWVADGLVTNIQLTTSLSAPPNTPERHYPERITVSANIVISIPTTEGGAHQVNIPTEANLNMKVLGGNVVYQGSWIGQHVIEVDEVVDLGSRDLTPTLTVDNRQITMDMGPVIAIEQGSYRGNQALETVSGSLSYGFIETRISELGVGSK